MAVVMPVLELGVVFVAAMAMVVVIVSPVMPVFARTTPVVACVAVVGVMARRTRAAWRLRYAFANGGPRRAANTGTQHRSGFPARFLAHRSPGSPAYRAANYGTALA
jgi:hypothetical protein